MFFLVWFFFDVVLFIVGNFLVYIYDFVFVKVLLKIWNLSIYM